MLIIVPIDILCEKKQATLEDIRVTEPTPSARGKTGEIGSSVADRV
jgi:hypothetical protein